MKFPGRLSYPQAIINLVASFKAENTRLWQVLDEVIRIKTVDAPVKRISADYTVTALDFIVIVDCSRGSVTVSLPSASLSNGQSYHIKKIDAGANNVVIKPIGTAKIDDQASVSFNVQYQSYALQCDGANWYVV